MAIEIALAGNPNSGKTTMFNHLTGSRQYVGNWPGVTVEKKQGQYRDCLIQDLPGVYSLSPYTAEEAVTRDYLLSGRPNAILNIVDGTNLERNLYLTTQLLELGIPVVVAVNMIDIVRRGGGEIDLEGLARELGCPFLQTAASTGEGAHEAAQAAVRRAALGTCAPLRGVLGGELEHALDYIEDIIAPLVSPNTRRHYAVKLFEGDLHARAALHLPPPSARAIEVVVAHCERTLDSDRESIVANARYCRIEELMKKHLIRPAKRPGGGAAIDSIVTHRAFALPIFAAAMFLVYYLSIHIAGGLLSGFTREVLFGTWAAGGADIIMESMSVAPLLRGLVSRGIIGGAGAVLGFVPQIFALFFMLALLEECGYMSRIAFILDRALRRFGLSGKSFIPMLIGTGCSVPGILASRTIESERDRRMTVITTSFMPCGAKMPVIALIAGQMPGGGWWVAPACYFAGVASVMLSGLLLKNTPLFAGKNAPFVLELPAYRLPRLRSVLLSTWERGSAYVKKAGTIIVLAGVAVWFLSSFGLPGGRLRPVEDMEHSLLAGVGGAVCAVFEPLGFGHWQAAVATVMGFIAKEEIVGVFGVLYAGAGTSAPGALLGPLGAAGFLAFNLLCMPCAAAVGAIRREMNSPGWTAFAIAYQMCYAYAVGLIIYQFGRYFSGHGFTPGTAAALAALTAFICIPLAFSTSSSSKKHIPSSADREISPTVSTATPCTTQQWQGTSQRKYRL